MKTENVQKNLSKDVEYWLELDRPQKRNQREAYLQFKRIAFASAIRIGTFLKRGLDIAGSLGALIAFTPIFAITALAIYREDRGPFFFGQKRVGKDGQLFTMWKFRSMVVNADALKAKLAQENERAGVAFKMKNDPRVTRVGRIIRKYSIDELPQFWNVFIGDMSLVGPRPPVPKEVAEYTVADRQRLLVKPGITCLWQVGGRSDIDFAGQVQLDVRYIQSENILLDIKLLILTVPAVLMGKGAY